MNAHVGDHIVVESRKVGGGRKTGEVIDVIDGSGSQHYRIRWDDGHESVVYPSTDAFVTEWAHNN
jgi:Domain of unknown function (DUF1918)